MSQMFFKDFLIEAQNYFSFGEPKIALSRLDACRKEIESLPPIERLKWLGSIGLLLERNRCLLEAIRCFKELVKLGQEWTPRSIKTARDFMVLAQLYADIGLNAERCQAISHALEIYEQLTAEDRDLLNPMEVADARRTLKLTKAILVPKLVAFSDQETTRNILDRILQSLEREAYLLSDFPEVVVQQLYNDLLPFDNFGPFRVLRQGWKDYLEQEKRAWVELLEIGGPGERAWYHRYLVRTTRFPNEVSDFMVMPRNKIIAFSTAGEAWLAAIAETPRQLSLPYTPKEGRLRMANLDSTVGLIDQEGILRFFRISGNQPQIVDQAIPNSERLVALEAGLFALLTDGTLLKLNHNGLIVEEWHGLGISEAENLAISPEGSLFFSGKILDKVKGRSVIQVADLISKKVLAKMEADFYILASGAISNNLIFLGCWEGKLLWKEPWTGAPESIAKGTTKMILFSRDLRYECSSHSYVQLNDTNLGVGTQLHPPGGFVPEQMAFSGSDEDIFLHVAAGNLIATWGVKNLQWGGAQDSNVLESAFFDKTGERVVGVGTYGDRYLWEIGTGKLLELEKFRKEDVEMHPIEWSHDGRYGAVCHPGMVEIINADGEYTRHIAMDSPHSTTWDASGKNLAFTSHFHKHIVALSLDDPWPGIEVYSCDDMFATSLALSPDGGRLAYGRNCFGPSRVHSGGITLVRGEMFDRFAKNELVLLNRSTRESRVLLSGYPVAISRIWFLSKLVLAVMDEQGTVIFIDLESGRNLAHWWAMARIVGLQERQLELLLIDSGDSTLMEPLVYRLVFHHSSV